VSLLWPEKVRIGLGASYAVCARTRGRKVIAWRMQQFTPIAGDTPWQAPLRSVGEWLAEQARSGTNMEVVLSSELAPLHLLPWREDVTRPEQQVLLAQSHFRQVYGEAAASWKTSVQATGYGAGWLASGVDEVLLQALGQHIQARKARINAVTPLALSLFNGVRRQMKKGNCWMLVAEPARMVALHFRQRRWQLLHTLPAVALQHETVWQALQREARLAGLQDEMDTRQDKLLLLAPPSVREEGSLRLTTGWIAQDKDQDYLHLLGAAA
jgi:hypothetical protein